MSRPDRLTGLEQYLFERAGYFVRRGLVTPTASAAIADRAARGNRAGALDLLAETPILDIVTALLDGVPWLDGTAPQAGPGQRVWFRGCSLPLLAPPHVLARHLLRANVRVATVSDSALQLFGGTHSEPLTPDVAATLSADPSADLDGAVRLRLSVGDVAFLLPCLLHRQVGGTPETVLTLSFSSRILPPLDGPTPPDASDLPPWLAVLVRH